MVSALSALALLDFPSSRSGARAVFAHARSAIKAAVLLSLEDLEVSDLARLAAGSFAPGRSRRLTAPSRLPGKE